VTAFALGCIRELITTGTEKGKREENVVWKRPQKGALEIRSEKTGYLPTR
jgi:hypothetical protein